MRRAVSRMSLLLLVAVVGLVPVTGAGAAEETPPGDPPGNNGTIKVKKSDPAADPNARKNANQPHITGCVVWLSYLGFDEAQTADITFTAQPPSGKGEVLLADKGVAVSPDPAGGGQDQDVVIAYNLTSAVQGLKYQKNQGYHIKVASDTKEAPGGAKQKVFWIDCAPAPVSTLRISKAVQGAGTGPFAFSLTCNHRPLDTTFTLDAGGKQDIANVPAGTTCVATETDAKGASDPVTKKETPADDAADGKVKVAGATPTTITFTNVFPGEGATPAPDDSDIRNAQGGPAGTDLPAGGAVLQPTTVLGAVETQPESQTTLPRTGRDPRPLATTGLWALGAGGLALLGGRRCRRS
jgi:hypothetical protein